MYRKVEKILPTLQKYIKETPLEKNIFLSEKFNANIYFKREDQQFTRSFKLRGSINKILKYPNSNNLVTASAGNHAQGVAHACRILNKQGTIFLPITTPLQKINRIKYFGKDNIIVNIYGNNFNESLDKSLRFCKKNKNMFIHPYDDLDIIEGQSTIAYEILNKIDPDYILCSVGGGGLCAGISELCSSINHKCEIIGVEPYGAASLTKSIKYNKRIKLDTIDTFVDGASVSQIGERNYNILKNLINKTITIKNGYVCHEMINIYQNEGIILEPAGVLPICALEKIREIIKGKTVVCILSGGNNDITRYNEIMEYNLNYLNLKHYFIVDFVQKPNQLQMFVNNVLNQGDDITRFEYIKKSNRNFGKVFVGIELEKEENLISIINNLNKYGYEYEKIEENDIVYDLIV
jgi:threonine dehydratase